MRTTRTISCLLLATALVAPPVAAQENTQANSNSQPAEQQGTPSDATATNASSTAC